MEKNVRCLAKTQTLIIFLIILVLPTQKTKVVLKLNVYKHKKVRLCLKCQKSSVNKILFSKNKSNYL